MTNIRKAHFFALLVGGALLHFTPDALGACTPMPSCASEPQPVVSVTSPASGATFTAPASITFAANAYSGDPDVQISAVEFFLGSSSIGIDSAYPYSITYSLGAGSYSVTAKATDESGTTVTSTAKSFTVNAAGNVSPPTVSMTSPANNYTATAPATIVLSATAADADGIASVAFKSGTTVINTDSSSPYSFSYANVAAGNYTFTAVATDNKGASTTSAPISVTVNPSANVPPTVSLTAPTNNSSYPWGSAILMSANAADTGGSISKVQFLFDGAVVGEDTTSPYSFTYAPSSSGTKSLTAVAYDNAGASTTSSVALVTVVAPGQVSETRSYVYDANHRLCKTINPESGASVVQYGVDGNIAWTAEGQALPSTTACDQDQVPVSARITREYDELNRVTAVRTPDGSADVLTEYYPDGAVKKLTASNPGGNTVVTEYEYNHRRLLTKETQTNNLENVPNTLVPYVATYAYTANGHLRQVGYPDNEVVDYAPDALGRPTQVVGTSATYATGITYWPNGAMSGFTYGPAAGGGPTHEMQQNLRQLPWKSHDYKGTTNILDDTYSYDANGNVTDIVDGAQTGPASQTRGMGYDDLDRLWVAVGPWGNATYSYDALDNLRSADLGARQFRYNYDANWRLQNINSPAGAQIYAFTYDAQGNTRSKNSQAFGFDLLNRMASAGTTSGVLGSQTYRYDGMGRRVQTTDPGASNPPQSYYFYSRAGQILYAYEARTNTARSYIYLNGSQIATRAMPSSGVATVRYQMTDALGSPVASTDPSGSSIQRSSYNPWGESTPAVDGTGYTGHVMDGNTGLTYMQQRYYDPTIGRFTAEDPLPTDPQLGANFNEYWYANNNPYRFKDKDGRQPGNICDSGATGCETVFGGLGKREEKYVVGQLRDRGIDVLEQVKLTFKDASGKTVEGVADYVARIDDRLLVGEIKAGMFSKFSGNQKIVYSAIRTGSVRVVSSSAAERLGLAADRLLNGKTTDLAVHALEGGRAWRQATRMFPQALRLGSELLRVADAPLLFFTVEEASAYSAAMDTIPFAARMTSIPIGQ
jgi:RHS repeat-associated protein